jgi:hypothetical protein
VWSLSGLLAEDCEPLWLVRLRRQVMGVYENDVFISYAHIDNQLFSGVTKGWIDYLHERLEIRLAQLLGKTPHIWRDRKLGATMPLTT